jgi:hypothetical protein
LVDDEIVAVGIRVVHERRSLGKLMRVNLELLE